MKIQKGGTFTKKFKVDNKDVFESLKDRPYSKLFLQLEKDNIKIDSLEDLKKWLTDDEYDGVFDAVWRRQVNDELNFLPMELTDKIEELAIKSPVRFEEATTKFRSEALDRDIHRENMFLEKVKSITPIKTYRDIIFILEDPDSVELWRSSNLRRFKQTGQKYILRSLRRFSINAKIKDKKYIIIPGDQNEKTVKVLGGRVWSPNLVGNKITHIGLSSKDISMMFKFNDGTETNYTVYFPFQLIELKDETPELLPMRRSPHSQPHVQGEGEVEAAWQRAVKDASGARWEEERYSSGGSKRRRKLKTRRKSRKTRKKSRKSGLIKYRKPLRKKSRKSRR